MDDDKALVLEAQHRQCVEELFDGYADEFDDHLVDKLKYGVPRLLRQVVPQRSYRRCLDLGCGTGLAGVVFRDTCTILEGVDLSSNMVQKAEERGIYDQLDARDCVAHLRRQEPSSVDLLISADVVMYLYSLQRFFQEAQRVVEVDGVFAFSTESATEEEASEDHGFGVGVVERVSERFAHSRSFVLGLAKASFELTHLEELQIRRDGATGILGDVFVFRRTAASC